MNIFLKKQFTQLWFFFWKEQQDICLSVKEGKKKMKIYVQDMTRLQGTHKDHRKAD